MVQQCSPLCSVCNEAHDETVTMLMETDVRRIADGELAAELIYVQRELADHPAGREPGLRHRLSVLKSEGQRRRQIAARGGPLYRGRGSIPQEKIAEVKASVSISDLIARDVPIAWVRGDRTHFYCTHGGVREKNPSLVAYEDQGTYHCFGCGLHGDQLDWVMSSSGVGFRDAVDALS